MQPVTIFKHDREGENLKGILPYLLNLKKRKKMKLDINSPKLIDLEMLCIGIIHEIDKGDTENAKSKATKLRERIVEERDLIHQYRDLFFAIANKL